MIRETSLETYSRLKNYLGECQIKVLREIKEHPHITRKEISHNLDMTINNVCGRVRELIYYDLIKEGEKRQCSLTKNMVNSLHSIDNIDYNLLDMKKHSKKSIIKLEKKHLSTINKLLTIFNEKISNTPLEWIRNERNKGIIDGIINLKEDIGLLLDNEQKSEPFLYSNDNCYMLFKVGSNSREIYFDVEYNRTNNKISCNCEDFQYNKKGLGNCKHITKVIKKFGLQTKENKLALK